MTHDRRKRASGRGLRLLQGAALALLSGCGDGDTACSGSATANRVRDAAEQAIRNAAPTVPMQFRGVQVYRQAVAQHFAVCGQVAAFADDQNIFVPFVSLLAPPGKASNRYRIEQHVGTSTAEASLVYIAMTQACYEGGGPSPGPLRSLAPLPPLPETIPDPRARPAAGPGVAAGGERVAGSARAILSRNTDLHATPHGRVLRVLPRGTTLRVFAEAPGGWLQVGEQAPWGWMHESMLQRNRTR